MMDNNHCDELKIYPVFEDPDRPNYRETHENILAPPFRMCIVGASKTGKSVLLMNYVARSCYWGGDKDKGIEPLFEKIIVFSPNLGLDSSTRHLKKLAGDENIYTDYHDHMIDEIIQGQKNAGLEREKILIIADDLIALGCSPMSRIFTATSYLRHLDCSIVFLTQTYQSHNTIPTIVKNNLEGMVWFKSPSSKQSKSFCQDLSGTFGTDVNVKNMIDYATLKPFEFAFFNYRDLTAWRNHEEKLWEKFDENGNYNSEFVPRNTGTKEKKYIED